MKAMYTLKVVDSAYSINKVNIEYDRYGSNITVLLSDVFKLKLNKKQAKALKTLLANKYKLKVVRCAN